MSISHWTVYERFDVHYRVVAHTDQHRVTFFSQTKNNFLSRLVGFFIVSSIMLNIDIFDAFAELVVCIVFKLPHDITNLHGYVHSGEDEKSSASTQNSSFDMEMGNSMSAAAAAAASPSTIHCAGSLSRASFSSSVWTMAGPLTSVHRSTRSPSRSSSDRRGRRCISNNSSSSGSSRRSNSSCANHRTRWRRHEGAHTASVASSASAAPATLSTTPYSFVQLSEEEELVADRWAAGSSAALLSPLTPVCVPRPFEDGQQAVEDETGDAVSLLRRGSDVNDAHAAGGRGWSDRNGAGACTSGRASLLRSSCRRRSEANGVMGGSQSSSCENSLSEYICL